MGLFLNDITPLQDSDDYTWGYVAGQRTCNATAYLRGDLIVRAAIREWARSSRFVRLNRSEYVKGFCAGYRDQLSGTAHPLPQTDTPYGCRDIVFGGG